MGVELSGNNNALAVNADDWSTRPPGNFTSSLDLVLTNGSGESPPSGKQFDTYLVIYVSPIIFILGVGGNALTIAVSRRQRLRTSTAGTYLQLMAIADMCVLIFGLFPDWLTACQFVTLRFLHPWTCKLEKFLSYTSGDVAIWLLVAFTFDRFIAVCFPLKKSRVCTLKRAAALSSAIFVICIAKNLPELWLRGWEYHIQDGIPTPTNLCGYISDSSRHYGKFIRPWIAFTLVSAIPFCLILAFNVAIVRTLLKMRDMGNASTNDKTYYQTTIMCLSASFMFLICITPSIVLLIGKPYWTDDGHGNSSYVIAKAVNNQLVYINHSMNFFLYCLTGKRFREELIDMFKGKRSTFALKSMYHTSKATIKRDPKLHVNGHSVSTVSGCHNSGLTYEETVSTV